jgi:putative methionine-R-sulfoxide reductase with GAF domain
VNFFQKYKLNQKHFLIITVFTLLLVFFVITYFFYIRKIQQTEKYNTDYYHLQTYYYQITNLRKEALGQKEFDNDFYNSTPENHIPEIVDIYNLFTEKTTDIKQNKRTKKYGFELQINKISEDILNYYKKIVKILSLEQEIGKENFGISKNLFVTQNDINKILDEEVINPELNEKINKLFEIKSNFEITNDILYYEQFGEIYQEINIITSKSDSTDLYNKYITTKIFDLITEFKDNFYLIIEKRVEIGLSETEGIYGELNDIENIILENINTLIQDNQVKNSFNLAKLYVFATATALVFILLTIILLSIISKYYNKNILKIKNKISLLATGELTENKNFKTNDIEFGFISTKMQELNSGFREKFDFANKIKNKEFDAELKLLSENDLLGKSLVELKESLEKSEEESLRLKKADDIQNWKTLGLAKFGEVMRKNTDNLQQLSREVIKNLIEYIDAAQGGFYIYNDENQNNIFLELMAYFAYGKEKIANKQIQLYEGLIGTCAVEKSKFYFKKIPDQYIYMSSGFGQAKPESLIILPLTVDKNVYGVIELASTREIYDYEIDFLDKLAIDIAITVSYVKINDETARFLKMSERQTRKLLRKQHDYDEKIAKLELDINLITKSLIKKEQVLKLKDELIADKVRDNKKVHIDIKNKENYIEKINADLKESQYKIDEISKINTKEKTEFQNKLRLLESEIQRLKDIKEDK